MATPKGSFAPVKKTLVRDAAARALQWVNEKRATTKARRAQELADEINARQQHIDPFVRLFVWLGLMKKPERALVTAQDVIDGNVDLGWEGQFFQRIDYYYGDTESAAEQLVRLCNASADSEVFVSARDAELIKL